MSIDFSRESIRLLKNEHIWVPRISGRAAAAGLSMHSPCRPTAVFIQRALYGAVRLLGPHALPGSRDSWEDPVPSGVWESFVEEWHALFGAWDSAALYRRPQGDRTGFAILLLRDGRGVGFVRVATSREAVQKEFDVMRGVYKARPTTFIIARPACWGAAEEWAWLATESVPNYPLGAVKRADVRLSVTTEIGDILDKVLVRTEDTPSHWRGSHGDLSPWNLRRELRGAVRVIDWEDAGFAPPGVDELYGALTAHLTFGSPLPCSTNQEAATWLATMISARRDSDKGPKSINNRLLGALAAVPSA